MYNFQVEMLISGKLIQFIKQAAHVDAVADWLDEHFPHADKTVIYPL